MSVSTVLALITFAIAFLGFGGLSVFCFSGRDKMIGSGIFFGIIGLFFGAVLALAVMSL